MEYINKLVLKLFHINRGNYNTFDKQIYKMLFDLYQKGIKDGIKQEKERIKFVLK